MALSLKRREEQGGGRGEKQVEGRGVEGGGEEEGGGGRGGGGSRNKNVYSNAPCMHNICSMQFRNLPNLEIVLHILRIR